MNGRGLKHRSVLIPLGLLGILVLGVASAVSEGFWVRLQLIGLKSAGALEGVSLTEIPSLLRPHSGFNLPTLVSTRNPYAVLELPATFHADSADGARIFESRCATCHGPTAEGGVGPALAAATPKHGATDWAMFRVIRDGVPGTPMRATGLSFADTWRVIAHVRSLQHGAANHTPERPGATAGVVPVSAEEIAGADTTDDTWLAYAGGWSGRRNKDVPELTAATVRELNLVWAHQLSADPTTSQTTPIAVRGLLLLTTVNGVTALSQRTGEVRWRFYREPSTGVSLCCGRTNRGVAVLGSRVYYPTLDAHLIALDLATGKVVWDVVVADYLEGYSMSGAPLVAGGKVIVGVGGSEFGVRGFLDAYDPNSGERLWRFHTLAAPGTPGGESWPDDAALRGGGGTWVTGAYDPDLGLVFWGTGNPAPDFAPEVRPGDNLYTCSVIALDVRNGRLKWSYQFTPNDSHDWDAAQQPVLVETHWNGKLRKLLLMANRNGFFYVLDRVTGEFLRATPYVRQTWNDGFDSLGRPKVRLGTAPTPGGTVVYPSVTGATNWWSPAYSDSLGLLFVPTRDMGSIYFREPRLTDASGQYTGGRAVPVPSDLPDNSVTALDVQTGLVRWRANLSHVRWSWIGGLLAIGGRLVIGGHGPELFAYDAATGKQVWSRNLGATIASPPIVFRAQGKPRLAAIAGTVLFVFELDGIAPGGKTAGPSAPTTAKAGSTHAVSPAPAPALE